MSKYRALGNELNSPSWIRMLIGSYGETTLSTYHDNVNKIHKSNQGSNYKAYQAYVELLTNEMVKLGYTKTDNVSPEDNPARLDISEDDRVRDAKMAAGYKQYKFTGFFYHRMTSSADFQPNPVFDNNKYVSLGETMTKAVFEKIKEDVNKKIIDECSADQGRDSDFDHNPSLMTQIYSFIKLTFARSFRSKPMNDLVQHIINEDKAIQDKKRGNNNSSEKTVKNPGIVERVVNYDEQDDISEKLKTITEHEAPHYDPTKQLEETIKHSASDTSDAKKNYQSRIRNNENNNNDDREREHFGK
mgnify:CR=1 FL=1